jgi:predicted transposase YbfD/YdcC
MDGQATAGVLRYFKDLPDPRAKNVIHKLHDIIVLALCAVICGADGWVEVEMFAQSKQAWFKTFLDLAGGIPSHDTFGRVFAALNPDAFERCFIAWTQGVAKVSNGRLIAFDGKAIRRSFEHAWDSSGMTHLVSAFVRDNQMVFGQIAVADKSNEITAIPKLLQLLDLSGAVVTIDAMGCQREIAEQIVEAKADYVLAVKENQPTLRRATQQLMTEAALDHARRAKKHAATGTSDGADGSVRYDFCETVDGDHGRIETRRVLVCDEVQALGDTIRADWKGLGCIVQVQSIREVLASNKPPEVERRLYISSIKGLDAARMGDLVRGHWSVENNLHWQLDVSFREDERRIRKDHGAENYSRLCRLALNLLKAEKTVKAGIKAKRLKAGWDEHYLLRLLTT